jgi:hypothetical protein
MKIYKLIMTTDNLSADESGYFSTKEKAQNEQKRLMKICTDKEYYGNIIFKIEEDSIDEQLK